jgi:hypothetical protein
MILRTHAPHIIANVNRIDFITVSTHFTHEYTLGRSANFTHHNVLLSHHIPWLELQQQDSSSYRPCIITVRDTITLTE